ncbi:MAG: tetratricopeptide repeat protein [Saprospirales bacterium]|nr:tetratricopeptide repeat protein [Saprospirales bacterium]
MRILLLPVLLFATLTLHAQIPSLGGDGPKTWAVIAGISDYKDPEITDLHFAHRDAKAFYDFLTSPAGGSVPGEQVQLFLNEKATNAAICTALYGLVQKVKEGDQVFIYFSGHGDVEINGMFGFLLPYDSPPRVYVTGAIDLSFLQRIIATLSNQNKAQVFMVADACHSGQLAGSAVGGTQITAQNLQLKYANEVKFLACGPEELSQEGEQWGGGRGAFSFFLIDGLMGLADQNGDYEVNLYEIRRYLEDKVPPQTAPDSQYPLIIFDRNASVALVDPDILARLKEERSGAPTSFAAVATRGIEAKFIHQVDSSGQELYKAYQLALSEKRLLSPESNSAYYYFQQLAQLPEFAPMEGTIRQNLAVALQDDAQEAVNSYLKADPQEMARRWKEGRKAYAYIPSYLDKSVELLGPEHYIIPYLRSKQYYFEAMLLRMEGEETGSTALLEEGIQKLQAAITLEPRGAHLYNEMGLIESGLDHLAQEKEAYLKAHQLAPAWVMPAYNLGILSFNQDELDSALWWTQKAILLNAGFAPAYNQLGRIYLNQGNVPEAEKAYLKSIELDSTLSWAYTNLGSLYYYSLKDYAKAEAYATKAMNLASNDPEAYYLMGTINLKTEHFKHASELYEQAILLNPAHPYAHFGLGLALEKEGDVPKAIAAYQKNLEITPGYPTPAYNIAALYAAQNDSEKALSWLEVALKKGYSNKDNITKASEFESLRDTEAFQKIVQKYLPE